MATITVGHRIGALIEPHDVPHGFVWQGRAGWRRGPGDEPG